MVILNLLGGAKSPTGAASPALANLPQGLCPPPPLWLQACLHLYLSCYGLPSFKSYSTYIISQWNFEILLLCHSHALARCKTRYWSGRGKTASRGAKYFPGQGIFMQYNLLAVHKNFPSPCIFPWLWTWTCIPALIYSYQLSVIYSYL